MARARSPLGILRQLLGDSARPIWIVDQRRQLAYGNAALETWAGVPLEALLGGQCDYHWSPRDNVQDEAAAQRDAVLAALAVPPQIAEPAAEQPDAGGMTRGQAVMPSASGLRRRDVLFVPLTAAAPPWPVLAIAAAQDQPLGSERANADSSQAGEAEHLHQQLAELRSRLRSLYDLSQLIGESPAMLRVQEQIHVAVAARSRVLILGPPGSGREHVARTIHYQQTRAHEESALIPLSCSLLDAQLLRGTVASVVHSHPEIEIKGPVTFLLLDADQLEAEAQTTLMGALNIVELDVHTLATSTRSLLAMAAQGEYRADLAHRLSTLVIELPPLAERPEDIPLLAQKLLEDANAAGERQWSGFTPEAIDQLVTHRWPNNLVELVEVVSAACQASNGPYITPAALPERFRVAAAALAHPRRTVEPIVLDEYLEKVEAELLRRALRRAKGNRSRAAKLLGISRARLIRRIGQLKLNL